MPLHNQAELQSYLQANAPDMLQTYAQLVASGDPRSLEEWVYDHLTENPQDPRSQNQEITDYVVAATSTPEPGTQATDVPVEQALLSSTLQDYVFPDIQGDPARRAEAAAIMARANAGIDSALSLNNQSIDGSRLNAEYANADQAAAARLAALAPLNAARITSAETAGAGINQALETERDRITADQATQGFYGGSSLADAARVRATIAARQSAAGVLGNARVANAGDVAQVGNDQARMRSGYFDSNYTRALDAALRVPGLESGRLDLATRADQYGQSGMNRAQHLLDWFTLPNAVAPQVQPYYQQPLNTGNDLGGLGTGLVGGALSYARANNYWQQPTTSGLTPNPTFSFGNFNTMDFTGNGYDQL